MEISKRNSNIELLRIFCMCFVIGGHIVMKYDCVDLGTVEYFIGNILRSFFAVAVNCFVLISGYFGIKLNYKKLLKISMQVLFYSISIYILTLILGIHTFEFKKDILLLIPIISKQYWFITIYFVLCILSPLLNIIIENINKEKFKQILIIIIVLFYILPTLQYMVNSPTITGDAGYGIVNFVCLYFIGRYIRIYYNDRKSVFIYAMVYITSSISLFLGNYILSKIFGFHFSSFISYDTIFLLISAIALFLLFKNISIQSNVINRLSEYALSAFIIHMHPTLFNYLFINVLKINEFKGLEYFLILIIYPIAIYLVSWGIEFLRNSMFNRLENNIINKYFEIFQSLKNINQKIS